MLTSASVDASPASSDTDDEDLIPLRCWECNVNFTERRYLYAHLFHHVRQPYVVVERCTLPPLKITLLKSNTGFEIVSNGKSSDGVSDSTTNLAELKEEAAEEEPVRSGTEGEQTKQGESYLNLDYPETTNQAVVRFSPDFANIDTTDAGSNTSSSLTEATDTLSLPAIPVSETTANIQDPLSNGGVTNNGASNNEYGVGIPGAEPTPPPEPSPDYPKIRIKTTGLLKEPLTITEITDDNPNGDPNFNSEPEQYRDDGEFNGDPDYIPTSNGESDSDTAGSFFTDHNGSGNMWSTPSLEDPLKLPDAQSSDDGILALFNGSDSNRAKDLGFHSTDSEFISLDRLEERNRGAMTLYNPSSSQSNQNPLDQLTGLPMQALAQQVSRLQPSNGGQMHQQNVLINIQQFPSGPPPQPTYQPPPMYTHHYPPQPMHQPYQYQPPNPMYYPPAPPGYPPQPHMPPPPQMPPISQPHGPQMGGQPHQAIAGQGPQQMPPTSQHQQPGQGQQVQQSPGQQYRPVAPRQPGPPRPPAPPGPRMPAGGPRQPMGQRQSVPRTRAPMVRPRGGGAPTATRGGMRPRMPGPPNGVRQQQSPIKRSPDQLQQIQAKKKKFDMLTPDKDDDDCQVICMQPNNTDGGLPQIASVQGGTSEPSENSIMHLSDSITLSVRNPPPKPVVVEPKKSDAKAVANILATRGITVTATAKPKEKESPTKTGTSPALPASLNLNGAVSIIPAKGGGPTTNKPAEPALPTVDLTDEAPSSPNSQKQRPGLPYRCDLCPATYPNAPGLNRHRQTYHKTTGGMCELGIPLINMKTPGALQRLANLGINNYIPLPSAGADGTFAMPIINSRNPGNVNALGASTMLSLGPIRTIPRPQSTPGTPSPVKQANTAKS